MDEKQNTPASSSITFHKVLRPEAMLDRVFGSVPATEGTAAHDYLTGRIVADIEEDSRYVGVVPQPDGALALFTDGSTALLLSARSGRTQ